MKASELTIGMIVLAIGFLLFVSSFSYPALPGQSYGAGTFPRIIGVAGSILGLILIVKDCSKRTGISLGSMEGWTRDRRLIGVAAVLGSIVFFILAAPFLGFIPTTIVMLMTMMLLGGIKFSTAISTSVIASIIIYYAFSRLLLVPLPRGAVEGLLW